MVVRHHDGVTRRVPDTLLVEEPMEIRLDDHLAATTMRTPGHDFELAVGFCHSEGLLGDAPIEAIRYCGTGSAVSTEFNVVSVSTGGRAPVPAARTGNTTSSCGLCGSVSIETLAERLAPIPPQDRQRVVLSEALLAEVAEQVRSRQELFARTGASHGAANFDLATGAVDLVREDIGRHNAVDKVVGRLRLDDRLPAVGMGLWVSGRASLEMVQKAWAAGFAVLVSVSAPSSLAIDTAERAGIVVVGFARESGFTVYGVAPI